MVETWFEVLCALPAVYLLGFLAQLEHAGHLFNLRARRSLKRVEQVDL